MHVCERGRRAHRSDTFPIVVTHNLNSERLRSCLFWADAMRSPQYRYSSLIMTVEM